MHWEHFIGNQQAGLLLISNNTELICRVLTKVCVFLVDDVVYFYLTV